MKFKSSIDKKPWEKISLDEIQPYPSKYNKIIVITYLFAFSAIFIKFMNVNSILEPFIPFIKLAVYGFLSMLLLKMVLKKTNESILDLLLFILPIYTLLILIIFIVCSLIYGISLSIVALLNPFIALKAIVTYFYIFSGNFLHL